MGNGGAAHGKFTEKRLHIADGRGPFGPRGGIAHMPDGQRTGQGVHHLGLGEIVAHIAKAAGRVEAGCGFISHNPARLLAAMLQGVQAKGHEV